MAPTKHTTNRQVDVASGQNTEQHAGGQDKYIGILGNQVVYVLRKKHLASRVHGKQYDDNRKSDNHCIFFQNL